MKKNDADEKKVNSLPAKNCKSFSQTINAIDIPLGREGKIVSNGGCQWKLNLIWHKNAQDIEQQRLSPKKLMKLIYAAFLGKLPAGELREWNGNPSRETLEVMNLTLAFVEWPFLERSFQFNAAKFGAMMENHRKFPFNNYLVHEILSFLEKEDPKDAHKICTFEAYLSYSAMSLGHITAKLLHDNDLQVIQLLEIWYTEVFGSTGSVGDGHFVHFNL